MATEEKPKRRLYRSRRNRMVAGVIGGCAEYFDVDPTILRVVWVVASILIPPMLLADVVLYIALAFVIPIAPDGE